MMKTIKRAVLCALALPLAFTSMAEATWNNEQVEQKLSALGYLQGTPDDVFDDATETALKNYQRVNSIKVTGTADKTTLAKLQSGDSISQTEYLSGLARTYSETQPLTIGSKGSAVTDIQNILTRCGCLLGACDGVYGEQTAQAVSRFQRMVGLPVTGIADSATISRLHGGFNTMWDDWIVQKTATEGDSGEHVRSLQRILKSLGYFKGECTGEYGTYTVQAVRAFQSENLDHVSGIADIPTVQLLFTEKVDSLPSAFVQLGDTAEDVSIAQQRLSALGYYTGTINGYFGHDTLNALRLFQLANALTMTGVLDTATYEALMDPAAISGVLAGSEYLAWLTRADAQSSQTIAQTARDMRGSEYNAPDASGFTFVSDMCISSGVPIDAPGTLKSMAVELDSVDNAQPGDILLFVRSEDTFYGIAAANERVIYATSASQWVLEAPVQSISANEVYSVRFTGAAS